jgi:hypothetical protein
LAGAGVRPDTFAQRSNMKNANNDSKRPRRNITWPGQPHPSYCDHEYEAIAHELGAALKRCFKCGNQETA